MKVLYEGGHDYMPTSARGVKKVNEYITQTGRAIIITEEDDSTLDWSKIPNGSLKVNPKTGIMSVKLEGETTWVPSGLKNDGTIAIAKDSKINLEAFTITAIDGNGTFTYTNTEGLNRTKSLTTGGKAMFELEKGTYINKRNALEVLINDTALKTVVTGGIVEVDESRFSMVDTYTIGTKITARYIQRFNIGNPYPRFFMNNDEPPVKEFGDFWLDLNDIFLNTGDGPVLKWWNGTSWISLNKDAHVYLSNKLTQEIADRIAAINAEAAARMAADNAEMIARIAGDDAERAARIAADDAEQTARIAADDTERAARIAADDAEAATRLAADNAEAAARLAEDNNLGARIDDTNTRITDLTTEVHETYFVGGVTPPVANGKIWFDTSSETIKYGGGGKWNTFGAVFL